MKIQYINKKVTEKTLEIINAANKIIEEYQLEDMVLTVRQLYYQFIGKDLFPDSWIDEEYNRKHGLPLDTKNTEKNYKRLSSLISKARDCGYVDWEAIEDRTRKLKSLSHWNNPGQIIRSAAWGFRLDHWEGQDHHVEVWIEKEALEGVIEPICNDLDVPFFACKGYTSQSSMWKAAQRLNEYKENGQFPVIIHLGDHDPSGIDMTRDIGDRHNKFWCDVIVNRIALNMDQIETYDPPPNPAKTTDPRCSKYTDEFGYDSWELDALEPMVMRDLIECAVLEYRDDEIYQDVLDREQGYKETLDYIEKNWKKLILKP